jgi:chemotaxis methyl-accepting protein methylase
VRAELAGLLGVTISRFWRNRTLWEYLAAHVLPGLCEAGARVWSCGCASGEEPYSLALLWRERCPESPLYLLATDIDTTVLERAQEGLYGPGSLRELPGGLRERYFRPERVSWLRLSDEVKGMVRFRRHDLLREPPPAEAPFEIILCRNLAFTYFGPEARVEAARKLAAALAPGGYLAVGRKERLPEGAADLAEADYPGLYRRET